MFGYCRATNSWHCQILAQVWTFGKQVAPQLCWWRGIPVHLHLTTLIGRRAFQPYPFSHHRSPSVQGNRKFSCLWSKQADLYGQANTRCNFHNITTTTWASGQVTTNLLSRSYDHLRSCRSTLVVNNFQILKHKTSRIQPCLTLLLSQADLRDTLLPKCDTLMWECLAVPLLLPTAFLELWSQWSIRDTNFISGV